MELFNRKIDFNPHFREGSDSTGIEYQVFLQKISIHTSAKEVTGMLHQIVMGEHDFNPHFREGNDRADNHGPACHWDFNPHFREGSDSKHAQYSQ